MRKLFEELGFAKNSDLKVGGIEKVGGEDSYALKGKDTTYYYSVKTGLKTGETKTVKANGQEFSIPTTFSNYKEVAGVKMPYTITVNQMGMEMTMDVKSIDINQAKDEDFK